MLVLLVRLSTNISLKRVSGEFRHLSRIKKTDFARQFVTRTMSKINKGNSVFQRMSVDST
jgi:hypothetical protein